MKTPQQPGDATSKRTTGDTLASWLTEREQELARDYTLVCEGKPPVTHCPTGFQRLDDAGLLELDVATIVLGHEGDGKSALGLQLLEGCAKSGARCAGFWPEDPRRFVADRVFSPLIGESASRLRRGKIDDPSTVPKRLGLAAAAAKEWAVRIDVCDRRLSSAELLSEARRVYTPEHRLFIFDYAQVLTAEQGEGANLVIARFVWEANQFAKEKRVSVVIMSQVSKEVKTRGRRMFDEWRRANPGEAPTRAAVEGYRPLSGDGQWSPTALGQQARAVVSWFRPHQWLREHGASVRDDIAEAMVLKNNYGATKQVVTLGWDGPMTRISDRKKEKS